MITWFKRLLRDRSAKRILSEQPPMTQALAKTSTKDRLACAVEIAQVMQLLMMVQDRAGDEDKNRNAFFNGVALGLQMSLESVMADEGMAPDEIWHKAMAEVRMATNEGMVS